MISLVRTAKAWRTRPSELLDLSDDPYTAYCLDEACAYILDQTMRRKAPKFPGKDKPKHGKGWTTNGDIVAQMRQNNQRYKEAGLM